LKIPSNSCTPPKNVSSNNGNWGFTPIPSPTRCAAHSVRILTLFWSVKCEIGIEASLTGHLVLSTLHTNSAPETIRLLDMGMDPFNSADALLGIMAQRLVRTLCSECKEAYHPDQNEFQALATEYGPEDFEAMGIKYIKDLTLYRPTGCGKCNDSGYVGRMAVHELLEGTDEIKHLIQIKSNMVDIREQFRSDGMTTLKQDGIRKVFKGMTDIRQIRSVCMK